MPFTLAHPLAVIPLARTKLALSALVIGSMSPDFEYFIRARQDSHSAHSILGLIVFCLPTSLLMLWLWHGLLKRPLVELLPDRHQGLLHPYLDRFTWRSMKQFALHCVAALIGAATHVVWDSFTHPWGWPVQAMSWMQAAVIPIPIGPEIAPYKALQYGSSLGGTGLLAVIYWRWSRTRCLSGNEPGPRFSQPKRLWICLILVTGAVAPGVIVGARAYPPFLDFDHFKAFTVRSIVVSNAVLLWGMVIYASWFRWQFRDLKDRVDSE